MPTWGSWTRLTVTEPWKLATRHNRGGGMLATARTTSWISARIVWLARNARFIYQRTRREHSFSKRKRTCCGCARTFHWQTRNSLLWKMDSPHTKSCCQSWPTSRLPQGRLPGNSAENISCDYGSVNSQRDRTIGKSERSASRNSLQFFARARSGHCGGKNGARALIRKR
jgi:hypothetical protein